MTDEVSSLDPDILDQQVYLNTRVSLRTRAKMDKYIRYMGRPENELPEETANWPTSIRDMVETAVNEWLAKHPMRERTGPKKDKTVRTLPKKQPKGKEE